MKIQSKNPSTIAHGKANLPEVGIVELSKKGVVEVPDAVGEELLTNSPDSWSLEGGENPYAASVIGVEAKEADLQENIESPDTIVAKYDDVTLDEEDLLNNPLLRAFGLKAGDEIGVPAGSEYTPEFSDDEEQESGVYDDNSEEDENESETQEKSGETEEEKQARLEAEAAEENELKKSLLKKNKDDLLNMAAALEIPQAEYQDLNKPDLVTLLIKATKEAE
jgi:hypothetical protein